MLRVSLCLFLIGLVSCQDIENGWLDCNSESLGEGLCLVNCNYGFIPAGQHIVAIESVADAACVSPVGIVAGGYNQDWNHDEIFLSSTELYSVSSTDSCDYPLPDLPVARKGMFGGWVGGMAVICGGEDLEGVLYSDCFYYSQEDSLWVYLQDLEIARSFAAAEILDGCLVISGGKTNEGPTDSIEMLQHPDIPHCSDSPGLPASLAIPVSGHCMVRAGQDIVVVGGGPESYGSTYVYNLDTRAWRQGAEPQKDRALHGCSPLQTADGQWAVVVAGNDFSPQDYAEIYFPSNDTWVWTKGDMNNERTGGSMAIIGGRPTILGGYGGDYCCKEYYTTAESYDDVSGHWWLLHMRNMTEGRKSLSVVNVPSTLFPGCS